MPKTILCNSIFMRNMEGYFQNSEVTIAKQGAKQYKFRRNSGIRHRC